MEWKEKYLSKMDDEILFENTAHRTRFKELVDCYGKYPFFCKGLCKCMYIAALDNEHFFIILEFLSDMVLSKEKDTRDMSLKCKALADEATGDEVYIYQLLNAFLNDTSYSFNDAEHMDTDILYTLGRASYMSSVIDSL